MRCSRPPRARDRAAGVASAPALSKNEPSAMAALMRGRSWSTRNPAPRLRWPTSLLPIWPAGRPTASPDASSRAVRPLREQPMPVPHRARPAARCAPDPRSTPNPSRTTRTTVTRRRGRMRRATMAANASGLSDAPPTSAPSMSGWAKNSAAFVGGHAAAVLDRHRVGGRRHRARARMPPDQRTRPPGRRSPVAASPVPMAQTGS